MKIHFKLFTLALLLLVFPCLFACESEYTGKEIESMEYITCDFMGGATYYRHFDLSGGEISAKKNIPWENTDEEYSVIATVDTSKNKEILNMLFSCGLFDLEEKYEEHDVIDGGSWTYIIKYTDGTEKTSTGINAGPTELFTEADISFFEITGEELFGRLPQSYNNPPSYDLKHHYKNGGGAWCTDTVSLESKSFTWKGRERRGEWYVMPTVNASEGSEHEITLVRVQGEERAEEVKVYSYEDSRDDRILIEHRMYGERVNFDIEENKSYIIVITYDSGTAEYYFNTLSQ